MVDVCVGGGKEGKEMEGGEKGWGCDAPADSHTGTEDRV